MRPRLICKKCGGIKFIGDSYYAYGSYYVDVTCVTCSDTKDIEVEKLNAFLAAFEKGKNANKEADSK